MNIFRIQNKPYNLSTVLAVILALRSHRSLRAPCHVDRLGSILACLGAILKDLGASWRHLGTSWRHLGPSWPVMARLGAVLARPGVILGDLGAFLCRLGAILAPSWAHLSLPRSLQEASKAPPKTRSNIESSWERSRPKIFLVPMKKTI